MLLFYLLHKPAVLGISLQGPSDSCNQLRCIQRPVKEGVDVAGLVGTCKKVVDPPQVNLGIVPSRKVLVRVVSLCYGIDMAVGKLHGWKLPFLGCGQVLIQACLADQLGKLVFTERLTLQGSHLPNVPFGIVLLEQLQRSLKQILHTHHPQLPLETVGRYTQVAANEVLEADKDLELLDRFFRIEIFVVVGPYSSNGKIEPIACYLFVNRGNLKAEGHALVIDGLVRLQKLIHGFVDSLGNPSLDNMRNDNFGRVDGLLREQPMSSIPNGLDKALMGDRHLIVLAEYGNDTIVLQMGHIDRLGVGLDKVTGTRCVSERHNRRCGTLLYEGCLLHHGEIQPYGKFGIRLKDWKHGCGGFAWKDSIARSASCCTI